MSQTLSLAQRCCNVAVLRSDPTLDWVNQLFIARDKFLQAGILSNPGPLDYKLCVPRFLVPLGYQDSNKLLTWKVRVRCRIILNDWEHGTHNWPPAKYCLKQERTIIRILCFLSWTSNHITHGGLISFEVERAQSTIKKEGCSIRQPPSGFSTESGITLIF